MLLNCLYLVLSVAILWKCADWFVEGAVGVAEKLHVPQMLVGLVLVSMATTSPELITSLMAALQDKPELALGNAVGSVIIDASVALGLAAVLSAVPLTADPKIFHSSAVFLIVVIALAFYMCLDGVLTGSEGAVLIAIYACYAAVSCMQARSARKRGLAASAAEQELGDIEAHLAGMKTSKIMLLFGVGFIGVLVGSHLLLKGALGIAETLALDPIIVGLTITAIGTSVPEIATCVAAALKRQSGIGVGNIIGADILNICWVAGVSSLANPLTAEREVILFMFPAVFVIVLAMLAMLRYKYQLTRLNGLVLLALYAVYTVALFLIIGPGADALPAAN